MDIAGSAVKNIGCRLVIVWVYLTWVAEFPTWR